MASTTATWEVVGKGKKTTKSQIPHLTKQEKKKFVENMPRIESQRKFTRAPEAEAGVVKTAGSVNSNNRSLVELY